MNIFTGIWFVAELIGWFILCQENQINFKNLIDYSQGLIFGLNIKKNMSFATTSVRSKIAFVCLVLAFVLHIVGFATPAWVILDLTMEKNSSTVVVTVQFGLWSLCSCVETECFCLNILSARGKTWGLQRAGLYYNACESKWLNTYILK